MAKNAVSGRDFGGAEVSAAAGDSEKLPAVFDLLFAAPLRDMLVFDIGAGRPVRLDGGAVERVATVCLQILVSAARAARQAGVEFRLERPSSVLAEAIADLGLTKELLTEDLLVGEN